MTDDWLEFEGRVIPMEWGNSVYTVLPLPSDITEALAAEGAKRVEVELNDVPFNMALTKAPVIDSTFLYTGKEVLRTADIAPGDAIDVRLRKADPDAVDVPSDVRHAITQAGLLASWSTLTPGKKRGMLHLVTSAKRMQTRQSRIDKLIDALRGGS